MGTNDDRGTNLKTVEKSLRIIDALQKLDGARVTELASHLDLPASTVHSHLATLERDAYVTKHGDIYRIGLQFLNRGGFAAKRTEGYTFAKTKVDMLAAETGERVQFVVEEHGRGFYLYTTTGKNAVGTDARPGKRIYLHDAAAGKSILSELPEGRVRDIVDRWGLPAFTDETITDSETLFEELVTVREQGYALNFEESVSGLRAIGVPVMSKHGQVVGAFSISGPAHRLQESLLREELSDLLLGAANEIELKLSYS